MRTVKMKTQTFLHENLLKHFPLQFNDTISPEPPAHNVCNTLLSAFRCDCPERSTQGPLELLLPGAVAFLCSEEIMIARRASGFLEPDAINISASAWQIVSFYSRRFCVGNCPQKAYLYTGAGSTSEQSMFVCLSNLAVSRTGDARLRIFFCCCCATSRDLHWINYNKIVQLWFDWPTQCDPPLIWTSYG